MIVPDKNSPLQAHKREEKISWCPYGRKGARLIISTFLKLLPAHLCDWWSSTKIASKANMSRSFLNLKIIYHPRASPSHRKINNAPNVLFLYDSAPIQIQILYVSLTLILSTLLRENRWSHNKVSISRKGCEWTSGRTNSNLALLNFLLARFLWIMNFDWKIKTVIREVILRNNDSRTKIYM